jgi:hypothetical protein
MREHLQRRHGETGGFARPISVVDGSLRSFSTELEAIKLNRSYLNHLIELRAIERNRPVRDLSKGHTDLILLTIFSQIKALPFDYAWLVEDDVDYSGQWGEFLRPYSANTSDLLCANLRCIKDDPDWGWWSEFAPPEDVPLDSWRAGYFPIFRASRRLISQLVDANLQWGGHYEAIWPTAALRWGYQLNDLKDNGGNAPPYQNSNLGSTGFAPGTLVWRPPREHPYFHENAKHFELPNLLYHPVKDSPSPRQRIMASKFVSFLKKKRRLILRLK